MSLFAELKRRNVFRVGIAYVVGGWLLLQLTDVLSELLDLPGMVGRIIVLIVAIGLPVTLFFAWAFEMTPEGIRKEKDVDRSQSITTVTGQKLNSVIIGILVVALAYFAIDKFILAPERAQSGSGHFSQQPSGDTKESNEKSAPTPVEAITQAETEEEPVISKQSIAVLPFVNMSSDEEQEYFSDGLSEELLNLLAKIPDLRVAARTSSFSFKGKNLEIPEIASRLKVAHVLEGSVRKSGNQLRITAQLIQASNGFHLWSETYDRQLDNVFEIQDEIADAVVTALKVALLGDAPRARETNPEAYQLFLEGQYVRRQVSAPTMPKAVALLKQAVEIDPGYAPAWTELAHAYMWDAGIGNTPIGVSLPLADDAVNRALEADPGYAQAYAAKGAIYLTYKFNLDAAFEQYQHALRLEPGNARLIAHNATVLSALGQLEESLRFFEKALELDPLMPEMLTFQGLTFRRAGQLDNAEAAYRTALTLSPELSGGHYWLGCVLLEKGMLDEAMAEVLLEKSLTYLNTGLGMVHHALGNEEASRAALDELIRTRANSAAYQIAQVYGVRGEADEAFDWLDRSLAIRDSGTVSLLGDSSFRGFRADPRWAALLEKLGWLDFWLAMPSRYGGPDQ